MGWIVCPSPKRFEVLTSPPTQCLWKWPYWEKVFSDDQFKIRLFVGAPIQYDYFFIKKRNLDTETDNVQRKNDVETQGERHLQARECLRRPEAKRVAQNRSFLENWQKGPTCHHVDHRLVSSRTLRETTFLLFKLFCHWYSVTVAPAN